MTATPRPTLVRLDDVTPLPAQDAPTKVRIHRLFTRAEHASNLTQGVCWMDPGEQTNHWSSRAVDDMPEGDHWYGPVDETYFIVAGQLRLTWRGEHEQGVFELGPHDSVYLAPGWIYHLENTGDEPAFFVYNMTPTQE
ncbi:MAG: cupin domain-containing protein [Nitriliruptoraceae bacterium]|nr:cupin domain-containing protein [Nitriliruptoraceae bacterium]